MSGSSQRVPGPRRTSPDVDPLAKRLLGESGSTSVLILGVSVVLLMVIGFGVALTGAEVDRNRLQFIADGAALYGSSAFDEKRLYTADEADESARIPTQREAARRVEDYLGAYPIPHERIAHIKAESVTVHDDGRVQVLISADVSPPLTGWLPRGVRVTFPMTVASEAYTH